MTNDRPIAEQHVVSAIKDYNATLVRMAAAVPAEPGKFLGHIKNLHGTFYDLCRDADLQRNIIRAQTRRYALTFRETYEARRSLRPLVAKVLPIYAPFNWHTTNANLVFTLRGFQDNGHRTRDGFAPGDGAETYVWPKVREPVYDTVLAQVEFTAMKHWQNYIDASNHPPKLIIEELANVAGGAVVGQSPWIARDKIGPTRIINSNVKIGHGSYHVPLIQVVGISNTTNVTCEMGAKNVGRRDPLGGLPAWGPRIFYPGSPIPLMDAEQRKAFFASNVLQVEDKTFDWYSKRQPRPKLSVVPR